MCVGQAHQSQEIKIMAEGRVFMGPVNFGDQRSCLGIGYSFLEGNNSDLNMMIRCVRTMTIKRQEFFDNQMSIIQSNSRNPINNCPYVQMWEQF